MTTECTNCGTGSHTQTDNELCEYCIRGSMREANPSINIRLCQEAGYKYQAYTYNNRVWTSAYGSTPNEAREALERKLRQSPQAQAVLQQVEDNSDAFEVTK